MERSNGSDLPNMNAEIPSNQESDLNVNAATDQIQEIRAPHSLDGLGALNEIPIEFIGSDVDFSLTDIANELQIVDGSNLVEYPTVQDLMTSTYTIESTVLESENPETKETDVHSVPADETSHKIDVVGMKETPVEQLQSTNPICKEADVTSVPTDQTSHKINAAEMKETVEEPESKNSEIKETDVLPSVPEDQTSKNKPTVLSNVVIRQAFHTRTDDSPDKMWNKHLHWPKVGDKPVKKGQQKVLTEQVPFAITSQKWKKMTEKKQNELLEKQEIAAKKVALREEKKKQKEEEKSKNKIKKEPQEKNNSCMKRKNAVVKKAKDMDKNNNTDEDNGINAALPAARRRRVKNNSDMQSSIVIKEENTKLSVKSGVKRKGAVRTAVKKQKKTE